VDTAARRLELARFLRARRARLLPAEVDLPVGRHRRTPGLRREEVAALAGVSVAWYTRLEQGRTEGVSSHALDAIARALRLSPAERAHLLQAGWHQPSTEVPELNLSPALQATVLLFDAYPPDPLNDRPPIAAVHGDAGGAYSVPVRAMTLLSAGHNCCKVRAP
jgi:transcriptional regulator with XRE-family HTH domain